VICPGCGCIFCDDYGDYPPGTSFIPRKYCTRACKMAQEPPGRRRAIQLRACEARDKKQYESIDEARTAAGWVFLRDGVVTYPYLCPCGWWHVTRQPPGTYWPSGEEEQAG
jgi:hypothetical protein